MQGKSHWGRVWGGGRFPQADALSHNLLVYCEASASVFFIASPGVGIDFYCHRYGNVEHSPHGGENQSRVTERQGDFFLLEKI